MLPPESRSDCIEAGRFNAFARFLAGVRRASYEQLHGAA